MSFGLPAPLEVVGPGEESHSVVGVPLAHPLLGAAALHLIVCVEVWEEVASRLAHNLQIILV